MIILHDQVKQKGIVFQLDIFGSGSLLRELEQRIVEKDLLGFVTLKGEVDSIEKIYLKYDIYLHTATEEPFGLSILEAMASGQPCVALDAKGNRELILNEKNGFLLSQDISTKDFSGFVIQTFKETVHSDYSQESIKIARSFRIEEMVDKIQDIY